MYQIGIFLMISLFEKLKKTLANVSIIFLAAMYLQACGTSMPSKHDPASKSIPLRNLVGLNAAEIIQLLGNPDFRHKELSSEMWQYNNGFCQVNIFIYTEKTWKEITIEEKVENNQDIIFRKNRVEYVDFQKINLTKENKAKCLSFLIDKSEKI